MRRAFYQALLRAPVKAVSGTLTTVGAVGTIWPKWVQSKVAQSMTVDQVELFSKALLIAGVLYFLLLWLLKPGESGSNGGGGPAQTTHGPGSPAVGVVHGDFINNPLPAEKQERKSPYGWTDESLAGLERVMRGVPTTMDDVLEGRSRPPEMPIWLALHKIAGRIGDTNELDGFPEARRQFRQEARRGRVGVWGKEQIRPTHLQDDRHRDLQERIADSYWREYQLHPRAAKEEEQESAHTEEEELPSRREGRFWSLMVHASDINRCWPKPPRTKPDFWKDDDDDRTDWKTV